MKNEKRLHTHTVSASCTIFLLVPLLFSLLLSCSPSGSLNSSSKKETSTDSTDKTYDGDSANALDTSDTSTKSFPNGTDSETDSPLKVDTTSSSSTAIAAATDTATASNYIEDTGTDTTSDITAGVATDSTTDSTTNAIADTGSDSVSVSTGDPLQFEMMKDTGTQVWSIYASDNYIFINSMAGFYQMENKPMAARIRIDAMPGGFVHQNVCIDDTYVYWLGQKSIFKKPLDADETSEISLPDSVFEQLNQLGVIVADEKNLYVSDLGCGAVVSVSKSSGETSIWRQDEISITSGSTTLAHKNGSVFCSIGDDGPAGARIVSAPGTTTEKLTDFVTVDDIDNLDHQVGPMVVVGDKLYFITNYGGQNIGWEKLYAVDLSGGEAVLLYRMNEMGTARMFHFDGNLYWLGPKAESIYKYEIASAKVTIRPFANVDDDALPPMDMDDQYIYLTTWSNSVWRTPRF